jgi:HlyD family secretion protein
MAPRWPTILLVAGLAAGVGYYYWQHRTDAKLDVQTVAAKRGDVRRVVSTSGAVSALVTVDIGSQLSGNVSEVNADYSSEVKKDQVLARIEPSTFETRVRQGEASVAVAKANVSLQQASVERAEANLHKAELDLHRAQELVAKGAGAQVTLDTAVAAQQSATADVDSAKA